jgi:NTE family protein
LPARRRVVFGTPTAPTVSVATAVQASCAIPGFYESVTVEGRAFVDGGVISTTNLDLAAGYDLVIGIVPMSYDRHSARPSFHPYRLAVEIYRRYPSRSLRAEMVAVREGGSRVVLVRPTVFEAQRHGFNLMDRRDRLKVAQKAYKTVAQSLATGRLAASLAEFGYGFGASRTA